MPTYEYKCEQNGETLEVVHSMSRSVSGWGELCEIAGRDPGDTPENAKVVRLLSASAVHTPRVGEWKRTNKKPSTTGHTHGPGCGCGH